MAKWYTPLNAIPQEQYPDFCLGSLGALISPYAIKLLPKVTHDKAVPRFYLEDVYLYGLVRQHAGIPPSNDPLLRNSSAPPQMRIQSIHLVGEFGNRRNERILARSRWV